MEIYGSMVAFGVDNTQSSGVFTILVGGFNPSKKY